MNSRVRNLVWGRFLSIEGPEPNRSLPSSALPSSLKEQVFAGLREPARHEFLAITRERDREIFEESLFNFAGREESRGNPAAAAALYDFLRQRGEKEALRHEAETAFRALHGEGPFAFRLERLGRDFLDRGSDLSLPAVLFLTGSLFQGVRLTALGGLWRSPVARFWTRGVGAEALAWGIGLTAEVPALTFGMRGINALRGIEQDGSAAAISRDLLVNGINLFAFKSAVSLVPTALSGMRASQTLPSSLLRIAEKTLPAGATFAGILAAQAAEAGLEPNNPRGGEKTLLDSLFTWLHLNLVGKLLGQWGNGRWERLRYEIKERSPKISSPLLAFPATAESHAASQSATRPLPATGLIFQVSGGEVGKPEGGTPFPQLSMVSLTKLNPETPLYEQKHLHPHFQKPLGKIEYHLMEALSRSDQEFFWHPTVRHQAITLYLLANHLGSLWDPQYSAIEHHTALAGLKTQLHSLLEELAGLTPEEISGFSGSKMETGLRRWYVAFNALNAHLLLGNAHDIQAAAAAVAQFREAFSDSAAPKPVSGIDLKALDRQRPWLSPSAPETLRGSEPYRLNPYEEELDRFLEIPGENQGVLLLGKIPEVRAILAKRHWVEIEAANEDYRWDFLGRVAEAGNLERARGGRTNGTPKPLDYLEAYDAVSLQTLEKAGPTYLKNQIFSRLRPGGIAYLVSSEAEIIHRLADVLPQNGLADILAGGISTRLPVDSDRHDKEASNYLFIQRLQEPE